MTGAVAGYVALLNENGSENEVLFLEAGGLPCSVDENLPMPIRGLRATVYETGKAAYENEFMNSDWVSFMPRGHVALRNVMFAPLNLEGRTVGLIGMANKPSDFTDADAEMATVFGDLAAVALMHSRNLDQLNEKNAMLEKTLAELKTLQGLIPMCANCKSVRDDQGFWSQVETYLSDHTNAMVSHSLCPQCVRRLYPGLAVDAGT